MALPFDFDVTWLNPSSVQLDAGELRRADAAAFSGNGSAFGVQGGIVRHGDTSLAVTVDGSDLVTVQSGAFVVPGNATAGTGCYRGSVSATTTGQLNARNATNPRKDLVVVRALDYDVVSGHGVGNYKGRLEIIAGTPSATPSTPALPTMAVEVARITVPQVGGGAATVDSSFASYATAIGGRAVYSTAARLPASAAKGTQAVTLDTMAIYTHDGTGWTGGAQTLTIIGSFNQGPSPMRIMRQGNIVTLQGSVTRVTNNLQNDAVAVNFATLPTGFRPPTGFRVSAVSSQGTAIVHCVINTDGTLQVRNVGTAAMTPRDIEINASWSVV